MSESPRTLFQMKLVRILLPPAIILGAVASAWHMMLTKPPMSQRTPPQVSTAVEATRVAPQNYQVTLRTQGTVRPRTESTIIPEVSGRVVEVAPAFRVGGFFETGELLLAIDSTDYETALVVAEASLAQARMRLVEEEARAEQAVRDWDSLGQGGQPSGLVLRQPQLSEARAAAAAAEARLERANRDFQRTSITAPYAGRVLEQWVDIGHYVTPGTALARIYAVDVAEIRLPLTDRQLAFVKLPELYRGESTATQSEPRVFIEATFGGQKHAWEGRIVRTEGAIDTRSRQLFVVAQVKDPYGRTVKDRPPLKVGLFVEATIEGEVLENVFLLPRSALRENRFILIVTPENELRRRTVEPIWSSGPQIVLREGLQAGEVVCLTRVAYAIDGLGVLPTIDGLPPPPTPKAHTVAQKGDGPPGKEHPQKKGGSS